jgi:beta-galactosidase
MVRLWLWEAVAHGAEVMSLFRWRRAPFAQEQMHAGLFDVDDRPMRGADELARVAQELIRIGPVPAPSSSPVALVFDYQACWVTDIQPQSAGFSVLRVAFDYYSALRRCGLDVDIVPPDADLAGYAMVVVPCLPILGQAPSEHLLALDAELVIGARTGSKTESFTVPEEGEPGRVQRLLPIRVTAVDGLTPGAEIGLRQHPGVVRCWLEELDTTLDPVVSTEDGRGVWYRQEQRHYLCGWPDTAALEAILRQIAGTAGLRTRRLEPGVRLRSRGNLLLAVNYTAVSRRFDGDGQLLLGGAELDPGGLALWRTALEG